MKAVLWTGYGPPDVLQFGEAETPVPKDDEVLIKIHATTVTAGDCEMRSLKLPLGLSLPVRLYVGLRRPTNVKIIGQELAGEIEVVGRDVTTFEPGDQVFAALSFGKGSYAEYVCLPAEPDEDVLALKPANMSYEEAAAVPVGGLEALHFLRLGQLQPGERLLINGSGGSIGTVAVQLAKHYGAHVTAVDSGPKLEMLRSIGADEVIDYTREDFTQSGQTYDVIFDVVGKGSYSACLRTLNDNGRYLIANPKVSHMLRRRWTSATGSKTVITKHATYRAQDLVFLKELIEAGKIRTVLDRRFPLEQMAEAHRYVEAGGKKGNVVINVVE